eukprot:COSAG06_NODE_643_length_13477_cov_19.795410_3_plen_141_part_00
MGSATSQSRNAPTAARSHAALTLDLTLGHCELLRGRLVVGKRAVHPPLREEVLGRAPAQPADDGETDCNPAQSGRQRRSQLRRPAAEMFLTGDEEGWLTVLLHPSLPHACDRPLCRGASEQAGLWGLSVDMQEHARWSVL